ncbi:MAG: hypothetical protein KBD76_13000 [Bacteriovorax sp.]|nr:hypothetical protein [Bacteriovorax sp.]
MKLLILSVFTLSLNLTASATLPVNFVELKALEKQEMLYQNALKSQYSLSDIQGQGDPGILESAKLLSPSYLTLSFTDENDELKHSKTKLIHTYGSVAKATLRITDKSKYTGILQSGASAIIRMSLAKLSGDYTPGMAMKLLVDGQISQHIFAMYSLDGQGNNNNFFANNFATKIAEPKSNVLKILATQFKKALIQLGSSHQDPTLQSVTDLAKVTSDGVQVAQPRWPFSLLFKPTAAAQMDKSKGQLRTKLAADQYSKGVVLYTVYAVDAVGSEPELLGEVVLESKFIASEYGDRKLFYRHNID